MTEFYTLDDAKTWLRSRVHEGERCPCCSQMAKVYRRKVHATMARDLLRIYSRHGLDWFHLPTAHGAHTGDFAKLAHWGVIVEETERREDGGRAGWWAITDSGEAWARRRTTLPKYAYIYDGRCLKLDGEPTSIKDALGDRFNYEELMQASAWVEGRLL